MDLIRLAGDLEEQFAEILGDRFGLDMPPDLWVCGSTMHEVVEATRNSYQDGRHHYPFSITLLKQIAINAFWIVKLKPINNIMIFDKATGCKANFPDVNETVAMYWAIARVAQAIKSDKLSEVITNTPANRALFLKIIDFYCNHGFYRSLEDQSTVDGSYKIDELIHNLRYKKFTAVNIYEVITHLILPFRAATVMSVSFTPAPDP